MQAKQEDLGKAHNPYKPADAWRSIMLEIRDAQCKDCHGCIHEYDCSEDDRIICHEGGEC